jgi:malonyl-CoA O-methyltransferase
MTPSEKKGLIKKDFSRAAATYDAKATLQRRVGEELLVYHLAKARLPEAPERLLDIGCGTGALLGPLPGTYPQAAIVVGCDISPAMARAAKITAPTKRVAVAAADCEHLPFKDASFDIAVSNLALQWSTDLTGTLKEILRVLRPGGVVAFSTLASNTFNELREAVFIAEKSAGGIGPPPLPRMMEFKTAEAIERAATNAGFKDVSVLTDEIRKVYPSLLEMLRTLKALGAGSKSAGGNKSLGRGALLKEVSRIYEELHTACDTRAGKGIAATYDVAYVTCRKA